MLFDRQYILNEDVVVEKPGIAQKPTHGRTRTATPIQTPIRCLTTITSVRSRWRTLIYPMCPYMSWAKINFMPSIWQRWETARSVPGSSLCELHCGKPGDFMKCPENIWTMKPLLMLAGSAEIHRLSLLWEAVLPPLPLIARGTFRGSSITPAGMWAGWEPRGSITSVRQQALPNPVIWCSSKAPMTRRA